MHNNKQNVCGAGILKAATTFDKFLVVLPIFQFYKLIPTKNFDLLTKTIVHKVYQAHLSILFSLYMQTAKLLIKDSKVKNLI